MRFIKSLFPNWLLSAIRPLYHGCLALAASVYFGRPSAKLTVIGITGTAGKSTTAAMLAHILNFAGKKCGYITTVNFFDGNNDYINKHGLSMPGGWLLQKQLKQVVDNGCRYAVIECTSEGLAQNRHLGINFHTALFTNLSKAHLEAHGGFENYLKAKLKLFEKAKVIGVNLDDLHAKDFLALPNKHTFGISFNHQRDSISQTIYAAKQDPVGFELENQKFEIKLPGEFNKYNGLLAVACANTLGVNLDVAAEAVSKFIGIRGRMEPVPNNRGIQIFVDYGCEPVTIRAALTAANEIRHNKLIHVSGTTGGHRDKAKRFDFGQASAELADASIFCNDDVYDSNSQEIVDNMLTGFNSVSPDKRKSKVAEIILDRRSAIHHALSISQPGDIVLITGKGSEQFLVLPGNKRIPWDEVSVVKEELNKL